MRKIPHLLIVDDNPTDVLLVQEAIAAHKLDVKIYIAHDGEEAARFIGRAEAEPAAPCPNLVVLDINLPRLTGDKVLERLRNGARCRDVPVLIATSSESPKERRRLMELGANQYFVKPSDYDKFMELGGIISAMLNDESLPVGTTSDAPAAS